MDKKELNGLAKKATELWRSHKYDEAIDYFEKVYPNLDHNHWKTNDFLICYGLNLECLGKHESATKILTEALDSTLATDSANSVTVTYARFSFGEQLFRCGQYEKAIEVISPSLDIECESKWLLVFLAARVYHKLSNEEKLQQAISTLLFLAPKNRFKSVKQIKALMVNESGH